MVYHYLNSPQYITNFLIKIFFLLLFKKQITKQLQTINTSYSKQLKEHDSIMFGKK